MHKTLLLSIVVIINFSAISSAGVIINAVRVGVSEIDDSVYGRDNTNLIDQSGLSNTYTPGVDDFNTFTSATTAQYDFSMVGLGLGGVLGLGSFYFDLGSEYNVDAIATWGQDQYSAVMLGYDLYASDTFGAEGSRIFIGRFSAGYSPNAYAHSFDSIQTRYLEIDVIENGGHITTRFNEVVFGGAIPEPATLTLLAIGGLMMRKRK